MSFCVRCCAHPAPAMAAVTRATPAAAAATIRRVASEPALHPLAFHHSGTPPQMSSLASRSSEDQDTSALVATNVQLESRLAASEALVRALEFESDGHRKAHEATALEALVARSMVEKHVSDTEYSDSGILPLTRSLGKGRSRSYNSLAFSSARDVDVSESNQPINEHGELMAAGAESTVSEPPLTAAAAAETAPELEMAREVAHEVVANQEMIQLKREREEALNALRASQAREALKERERIDYELMAELAKVCTPWRKWKAVEYGYDMVWWGRVRGGRTYVVGGTNKPAKMHSTDPTPPHPTTPTPLRSLRWRTRRRPSCRCWTTPRSSSASGNTRGQVLILTLKARPTVALPLVSTEVTVAMEVVESVVMAAVAVGTKVGLRMVVRVRM